MSLYEALTVLPVLLASAISACDEPAPAPRCSAPSGVYHIEWRSLPEHCEVVAELERIAIDFDEPCAKLLYDDSCSGQIDDLGSCTWPFAHGYARIFPAYYPSAQVDGSDPPRLTAHVTVDLADRLEDFAEGTTRYCSDDAEVQLVRENTTLDAGVPEPDGTRDEGDACLVSCARGLLCVASEDPRALGRCARPPSAGAACARSVDARVGPICDADSYCLEGTCRATPAIGEPCGAGFAAAPPICAGAAYCGVDGLCHSHPVLGEHCASDLHHPSAARDCATAPCCTDANARCDASDDADAGTCVAEVAEP